MLVLSHHHCMEAMASAFKQSWSHWSAAVVHTQVVLFALSQNAHPVMLHEKALHIINLSTTA